MQQKIEVPQHFQAASKLAPEPDTDTSEPDDYDDGLLATAGRIMIAAIGTALGIAALTFLASGEALFAVIISGAYAVVFFSIPTLLARIRTHHDARWRGDTWHRKHHLVSTFTGSMRRHEAVLQIVTVFVGVAFAFAAFSTIWLTVRPW